MSARTSNVGATGPAAIASIAALPSIAALVAVALLVAFGVSELYRLRFSTGDLYPYASSFRADPLGTKVLYEALREMPGVVVERHLRALPELEATGDTVVLLFGLQEEDVELAMSPLLRDAEALAAAGSRVVLAFEPVSGRSWADPPAEPTAISEEPEAPSGEPEAPSGEPEAPSGEPEAPSGEPEASSGEPEASSAEPEAPSDKSRPSPRWRIATRRIELPQDEGGAIGTAVARAQPAGAEAGLPTALALHSALTFEDATADDRSRVLYRRDGAPVVIERTLGRGSLVLVADGFLFANEGLARDRQPAILAWALGDARRVVFDESHLGVEEGSGVMVLARRYRLLPALGVLAVLAALFVWRSASGLLPPAPPSRPGNRQIAGGDAASGLADILARGLDPRELLPMCAERWAEDCARGDQQATRSVVELARQAKDPVAGYREIRAALATSPFRRGDHAD